MGASYLESASKQLSQARQLTKLLEVCDFGVRGTFPSVAVLREPAAFRAHSEALSEAVKLGVPKTDPRWLQALTFRVMAQRMNELAASLRQGEALAVDTATVARGTAIDKESGHALEDFAKLFQSSASHVLAFADRIDAEARQALKAQGLARYEKVSEEEIAQKNAEKESARMAAREAAEAMAKEDVPIEISDDLLD